MAKAAIGESGVAQSTVKRWSLSFPIWNVGAVSGVVSTGPQSAAATAAAAAAVAPTWDWGHAAFDLTT
eukprot:jgi/Chrpa1/12597/Chrysochromulina_OHIO_Genome00018262-RA